MRLVRHPPLAEEKWSHFWAAHREEKDRQREILEWCETLDGQEGMYHFINWSASGLSIFIREPNHAFLFKLRWK